jgi:hypothetical protein
MAYFIDVSKEKMEGSCEKKHSLSRQKELLGSVNQGLNHNARPVFCNLENGVLKLVDQNLLPEECVALKNYLIASVDYNSSPRLM